MRRAAARLALCVLAACRASGDPLEVLARQQAAWNRGDLEAFAAEGYARSEELVFFSGGDALHGYDAFLARFRARYGEDASSMGKLDFSALELVWRGTDAALVRGHWRLTRSDEPVRGGLFTLFLRRTSAGWRIVHDHTSSAGG